MKHCRKCGASLEDSYFFCHKCGADMRIPRCEFCGKELPENAVFCPWCGNPLAEKKCENPTVMKKTQFTEEKQLLFKKLLESKFTEGKVSCSPEVVCWEDSYTGWGAIDDTSWEDTTFCSIRPLKPEDQAKYAGNSVPASVVGQMNSLFREIVENSDNCLHYENLGSHRNDGLNIHWQNTLIVSNPYGTGMDVLITYESFDDQD